MSDTPRTDENANVVAIWENGGKRPSHLVIADFARQIERELNAALKEIESLKEEVKDAYRHPMGF